MWKINGLSIRMEDNVTIFGSRFRVLYGTFFIILGIATAMVTYKYVFPMGSIMLVLSGLILVFYKRYNYMMHRVMLKVVGNDLEKTKEIKE